MADFKADAPFVFEGSVKSLNASNVSAVPADATTAVVEVGHVRHAPRALAGLAGKEVTVRKAPGETLKAGDRCVFFADGLVFGDHLAVQSRGHEPLAASETVAAVAGAAPVVQGLRRRMDEAHSIISGRVVDVRLERPTVPKAVAAGAPARPKERISEHEPFWREAVIQVAEVHKGPRHKRVVVRFPASTDVRWRKAPKFQKGQTGLWLLHAEAAPAGKAAAAAPPSGAYTALDPHDFYPPAIAPVVAAMLPARPAPVLSRKTVARKPGRQKVSVKARRRRRS